VALGIVGSFLKKSHVFVRLVCKKKITPRERHHETKPWLLLLLTDILHTLQHTQHTATHCNKLFARRGVCFFVFLHTATQCKTLQHTATYCNMLQHTLCETWCLLLDLFAHTAAPCNTMQHDEKGFIALQHTLCEARGPLLDLFAHIATPCNTLQHSATHCTTLQHTFARHGVFLLISLSTLEQPATVQHTSSQTL